MINEYYQIARKNETVFRNILRDLRNNRTDRPKGSLIPIDLDCESTLDEIFQNYSGRHPLYRFSIEGFIIYKPDIAIIEFQSSTFGGADLEYSINENKSVKYVRAISQFSVINPEDIKWSKRGGGTLFEIEVEGKRVEVPYPFASLSNVKLIHKPCETYKWIL